MPTQQTLFDNPTAPTPFLLCNGGCGHELTDTVDTPIGPMCSRCYSDLYHTCNDCRVALTIGVFGHCLTESEGPDTLIRCEACHNAKFVACQSCFRLISRDAEDVRLDPNNSDLFYCRECWDNIWTACANCDIITNRHDAHHGPDSSSYCPDCFEASYVACSVCNGAILQGEANGPENDPYCEGCKGEANHWKSQPWGVTASTHTCVGSSRRFGVELETYECPGYRALHGETAWGCVYECSTSGMEFVSPILQGDEGFDEIKNMCDFAASNNWRVDSGCGLHIHLDAEDLSNKELLSITYAYRKSYVLWKRFVKEARHRNSMCGQPQYTCSDITGAEHFEDLAEASDRFEFINLRAYLCHGSIEIRLYPGTLCAQEICNWVAIHAQFIDAVKNMTFEDINSKFCNTVAASWKGLCELIDDPDLLDYWRGVIREASGRDLTPHWSEEAVA